MQVNKYTNKAAYEADAARDRKMSSVSLIENNNELVYDGVNVVVDKPSAGIGDLVVYDTILDKIRYVKSISVNKEQMPASLIPAGVVYARKGDKVLIVSLDNATYNGSKAIRWAASYEVALGGFDFVNGGEFTIKINVTNYAFTYPAGSTSTSISAIINAALAAATPSPLADGYGGWKAAAAIDSIIMTSNTHSAQWAKIYAVTGCVITRTPEDVNLQTTRTNILVSEALSLIRRNNRSLSSFACCGRDKVIQHYSTSGSTSTGLKPGSTDIIRESVFTKEDNPDMVAIYPTYKDYLLGEHDVQHPVSYGIMTTDGWSNTNLIGRLRFTDIHGNSAICYPAAAAALDYGVGINGSTDQLNTDGWWLPSIDELYLMMRDRVLGAADRDRDPVNRTLMRIGGAGIYSTGYYPWSSCEYDGVYAGTYNGFSGTIGGIGAKFATRSVRPVTSL